MTNIFSKLEFLESTWGDKQPDASVIWLHGLGADGYDFLDIVPKLGLPQDLNIRFIFPHAEVRPITIFAGEKMRAWFDVLVPFGAANFSEHVDAMGIEKSREQIEALIAREIARGILPQRIILAGFSQGATIAIHTALGCAKPLAGVLALSGFYAANSQLANLGSINCDIPIFLVHGEDDTVIALRWGVKTRDLLVDLECKVDWHVYSDMAHSVCGQEMMDIGVWLSDLLSLDLQ